MEITQELVKELFDYKDGFLYSKVKRKILNIGDRVGCLSTNRGDNRYVMKINYKRYYSSRIIFLWHHGYMPNVVDHKDRDKMNDRIENLRAATHTQNMQNRTSSKRSTSKHLGVCFGTDCKKWISIISIKGKQIHLGYFDTENKAAIAYNNAALIHHGEFANLNIIT